MREERPLFSRDDAFSVVRGQQAALEKEIADYDGDALLTSGIEGLLDYFERKYELDVPVLDKDNTEVTDEEVSTQEVGRYTQVSRVGTVFTYHVPYTGSSGLFDIIPNAWGPNPPRGFVTANELQIRIERWKTEEHGTVPGEFEGRLQRVRAQLDQLRSDFANFNAGLRDLVRARVETRRKKLLDDRATVASLGYRVRPRADAPKTYALPIERRKPIPRPPRGSGAAFKPEPEFEKANYERALEIIASMATVIEQSPVTFAKFTETDLRNQFLVQLNPQFPGEATAETFRAAGKTDIVILVNERAVFIAECKFYDGPKSISAALSQLLGYTTWRDTKLALLVFSRHKDFSAVLRSIDQTVRDHAATRRKLTYASETGFRYVLTRTDDPEREMTLTVLAFAVPVVPDA